MVASTITGGDIILNNIIVEHLLGIIAKLKKLEHWFIQMGAL